MALNQDNHEDGALTRKLIAAAEIQASNNLLTDSSSDTLQRNGNADTSDFLRLFGSVDVKHRLPLLDSSTLVRYRAMLQSRWILLSEWLEAASELPVLPIDTNQHETTSLDANRVLGSTLHHHFDSACKAVSCLVDGSPIHVEPYERAAMTAYIRVCKEQLQPATNRLHVQLAGAVTTGLLTDLATLLNHPGESHGERKSTRKKLRTGLSDLLNILDILSLRSTELILQYSSDYLDNGHEYRARRLLETASKNNEKCIDTRLALANLYARLGQDRRSLKHLHVVVLDRPDDLQLRIKLASMLLKRLEFSEAARHLKHSLELANNGESLQIQQDLDLATALDECEESAAEDDTVPTITLSDEERMTGIYNPAKLALAAKLYRHYGTLVIHNVYSNELIENCHEEFLHRYRSYFTNSKHSSALQIGNRRFQISLALAGAFNDPEFYANSFILPLMKRLLGDQLIIGSTVCATSLPGSRDQHGHKDHRALFTDTPDDDPMTLPPVSVTTMIPLVSINEKNGTTLVKKGSHKLSRRDSNQLDYQAPIVPAGSCYLMDLALTHKGQGNQTDQLRPIVNMVYHRSWFVDNKNFRKQPPLQIDSVEYRQIPVENRHLFDWAIQPGAQVNTPR